MRARTRLFALGALVVVLAACKADVTVTVRMHDDGSGVVAVRVALDADAVRAAEVGGGKLVDRVRLGDLTGAGWKVAPWTGTPAGGAVLTVTKPFSRPEQVGPIVRELNGAHGPLRGFRASRDTSTFSTSWKVAGTVDLRRLDLGIVDDQQLMANLTNERVDVAGVEQRIAASARNGLRVRARVEFPGGEVDAVRVVPGTRAALAATADDTDVGRILLVVAGIGVGIVAILLVVVGETRSHRSRRRRSVRSRP